MRRAIEDRQRARRGTCVRTFLQLPNIDDLHWHSLLGALLGQTIGQPETDGIAPLAEHVDLLSVISQQCQSLPGKCPNKFHSEFRMEEEENESRLPRTGLARIIRNDFPLPLRIQ